MAQEIITFCETCKGTSLCEESFDDGDFYCENCGYYVPTDGTEEKLPND